MRVSRLALLSTVLAVVAGDPLLVAQVEPVCLQNVTMNPGAFEPWVVYKYLKVNGPFVQTVSKDKMGGQTLHIQNSAQPILSESFGCVKEDNEWKARVNTASLNSNILSIKLDDGVRDSQFATANYVEMCLLQDISLYRSMDGMLGLRLDYGKCMTAGKRAIIMVGVRKVPDRVDVGNATNLRGFFQGVCGNGTSAFNTVLQFANAQLVRSQSSTCFAISADMVDISALDKTAFPRCFPDSVVFTLLDVADDFPLFPVEETDYDWLLSQLPVETGQNGDDDPCAPLNQPKQMVGEVVMDRLCVSFDGLADSVCTNQCGPKFCTEDPNSASTTPFLPFSPPALCIDCEWHEAIYAFIATGLVVMFSYLTYLSHSMSWVAAWYFVDLPGQPKNSFGALSPTQQPFHDKTSITSLCCRCCPSFCLPVRHEGVNEQMWRAACIGFFFSTMFWSFFWYFAINIIDWLFTVYVLNQELCIRLWGFQYNFDMDAYNAVNGTSIFTDFRTGLETHDNTLGLSLDDRGRFIFPFPDDLVNIDWCPFRLLPLIIATWLSTFILMCYWRADNKVSIMKTTITQQVIQSEEGLMGPMSAVGGSAHGTAGMFTKVLGFMGGQHVPSTAHQYSSMALRTSS